MPSATFGFLGNPESVDTGNASSSYTVPAGKYVWVSGAANNGSITINSETWLAKGYQEIVGNITAATSDLSVSINGFLRGHVITNSITPNFTARVSEGTYFVPLTNTEFTDPVGNGKGYFFNISQFVGAGETIRLVVSGGVQMRYHLTITSVSPGARTGGMWCKAGDVIAATEDATFSVAIFPA
jgi:hypothetical protein